MHVQPEGDGEALHATCAGRSSPIARGHHVAVSWGGVYLVLTDSLG